MPMNFEEDLRSDYAWRVAMQIGFAMDGTTAEDLASHMNKSPRTVRRLMKKEGAPDFAKAETATKLADAVAITNLFQGSWGQRSQRRLAVSVIWLVNEIETVRRKALDDGLVTVFWSRAFGPRGWARPELRRDNRGRIVGPLQKFYLGLQRRLLTIIKSSDQKLSDGGGLAQIEAALEQPFPEARFLFWKSESSFHSRDEFAVKWLSETLRDSGPRARTEQVIGAETPAESPSHIRNRSDPWAPDGYQSYDCMKFLPTLGVGGIQSEAILSSVGHRVAWNAALLSQRFLGLLLWSMSAAVADTNSIPRDEQDDETDPRWDINWSDPTAEKASSSDRSITAARWETVFETHKAIFHGEWISQWCGEQPFP